MKVICHVNERHSSLTLLPYLLTAQRGLFDDQRWSVPECEEERFGPIPRLKSNRVRLVRIVCIFPIISVSVLITSNTAIGRLD